MVAAPSHLRPAEGWRGGGYEEYHPYGSTAWWSNNGDLEVSQKRYRYTGMERDEENGLQCHGVRYYAPWLGRWMSADPIGLGDGVNRYAYCHDNPTAGADASGLASLSLELLNLLGCAPPKPEPQVAPRATTPAELRSSLAEAPTGPQLWMGAAQHTQADLDFVNGKRADFVVSPFLNATMSGLAAGQRASGVEQGGVYFVLKDGREGFVSGGLGPPGAATAQTTNAVDWALGRLGAEFSPDDIAFAVGIHSHPNDAGRDLADVYKFAEEIVPGKGVFTSGYAVVSGAPESSPSAGGYFITLLTPAGAARREDVSEALGHAAQTGEATTLSASWFYTTSKQ